VGGGVRGVLAQPGAERRGRARHARAELHHNQNRAAASGLAVVIEELGA
jgi:hypothetical protein